MTRTTNARVAGVTFLFYIASGISSLALAARPHATDVLSVFASLSALVLGVTLYPSRANRIRPRVTRARLSRHRSDARQRRAWGYFFAVGSTFLWLLLRGRMIPAPLGWLGVVASALLFVVLLAQRAGLFGDAVNWSSSVTWLDGCRPWSLKSSSPAADQRRGPGQGDFVTRQCRARAPRPVIARARSSRSGASQPEEREGPPSRELCASGFARPAFSGRTGSSGGNRRTLRVGSGPPASESDTSSCVNSKSAAR